MSESFAELFEQSLKETNLTAGSVVTGSVEAIDEDWVVVNAGLKSEATIPRKEFLNEQGELEVAVGDDVEVVVVSLEDGFGNSSLSRTKAKQLRAWRELESAFEAEHTVNGVITGRVRGGFTVEIGAIHAFLPGSLVDVRPMRDASHLEGKPLEFKLIKLDAKRNNVVVSRRAVLEAATQEEREQLLATLQEGVVLKGIVKNLTDYGAFIDLGGIDGLLHITDLSWKRVKHPSEIVSVGDEINVKVLRFDRESQRVSLGLKQLGNDPWEDLAGRYPVGSKVPARVTNITDYGCFAEIEAGIEGLVHVSEMDWTNKNIHPSKVVQLGQEVEVMVLDVDAERRRISLGMKQCIPNPWEAFSATHNKGDTVSGQIKSITDFGVFVGLEGNIDGLVHLSDLSWEVDGEEAVKAYQRGQDVEAVILGIDAERERISLGIKQLSADPFMDYLLTHDRGSVVSGRVVTVEAKAAILELADGVEATLRASELSAERVEDARNLLKEGEVVEVVILSVDRKRRQIQTSVKAKQAAEDKAALKSVQEKQQDLEGATTIGDLIKAELKKRD